MKTKNQTIIFSTRVHLQSVKCLINGNKQWRWVAVGFEDDIFWTVKPLINPIECAKKKENLFDEFQHN